MFMGWELIKGLFTGGKLLNGVKDIVDEVVTTKEEKGELMIKWKELLNQYEQEITKAEAEERISARDREVQLVRAGSKNITQNILAYIGVVSFFGVVGYILSKGLGNMAAEESFIVGNLTGMAGAIAKDIYGYYFGSSKGEHEAQSIKNSTPK